MCDTLTICQLFHKFWCYMVLKFILVVLTTKINFNIKEAKATTFTLVSLWVPQCWPNRSGLRTLAHWWIITCRIIKLDFTTTVGFELWSIGSLVSFMLKFILVVCILSSLHVSTTILQTLQQGPWSSANCLCHQAAQVASQSWHSCWNRATFDWMWASAGPESC